jgi:carbonic anhydrase
MSLRLFLLVVLGLSAFVQVFGAQQRQWHYEGHKSSRYYRDVAASTAWGYEGELGPAYWSNLDPAYATCGSGATQSPVSLSASTPQRNTNGLAFVYTDLSSPTEFINNGHTFEIEVHSNKDGNKSHVMWNNLEYHLLQFHFHQSSEHHRGHTNSPLELHLVHQNAESGKLLVVGAFLDKTRDRPLRNDFLEQFWGFMPLQESSVVRNRTVSWGPLLAMLDPSLYWAYSGSLTTPPCTEGVQWVVLSKEIPISYQQWKKFTSVNGFNARFTQPLKGRNV